MLFIRTYKLRRSIIQLYYLKIHYDVTHSHTNNTVTNTHGVIEM